MANQLTVTNVAGQLPNGFCPKSYQDILNAFVAAITSTLALSVTGIVVQQQKPTDTTQIWLQTDSSGRPVRTYIFSQGAWISLHTLPPNFIMIWNQALPDFTSFDGGDNNAPSAYAGPMWQQVTAMSQLFPVGVGTFPSGATVAVGGTGGEEKHTLLSTEIVNHTHSIGTLVDTTGTGGNIANCVPPASLPTGTTNTGSFGGDPGNNNATVSHNNLPPFYGVYFLQRTARLFYTVN